MKITGLRTGMGADLAVEGERPERDSNARPTA